MKKTRGPKRKHWSDLAKITAWYNRIQWVENCTDYELDNKYAFKTGFSQKDAEGEKSRIFEGIRKEGRIPRAYKTGVRNLDEIAEFVAKTEGLDDTYDLFYADIWDLFKRKTFSLSEVNHAITSNLEKFGLSRQNPDKNENLQKLIRTFGAKPVYDRSLRISLHEKNSLLTLPLLWYVYVQARSPQIAYVREVAELLIDEKVDNLFNYYFSYVDYHLYYTKAINSLTNTTIETSDEDQIGYGWEVEVRAAWPILPKGFNDFESINQDLKIDLVGP